MGVKARNSNRSKETHRVRFFFLNFKKLDFMLEKFIDFFCRDLKKKNHKVCVFVYYQKNHFFLKSN